MFAIFSVLLFLNGYFAICKRLLNLNSAYIPFFVIPTISLILYAFALSGYLVIGYTTLYWLGILFFISEIIIVYKNKFTQTIINDRVFIIFNVFFIFLWIILQHVAFYRYDEFEFWGLTSKFIYVNGYLPKLSTLIAFKDYPLAAAISHSIIYYSMGGFSERVAYFAQDILMFAPLFILFSYRNWRKAFMAFMCAITLLTFFDGRLLQLMYVDILVSIYFTCVILAYFLMARNLKLLAIIPAIALLPLIKQVGLLLAVIAWLTILMDQVILMLAAKRLNKNFFLVLIILPFAFIATFSSWKIHYHNMGVTKSFATRNITFEKIAEEFGPKADNKSQTIEDNFLHAIKYDNTDIMRIPLTITLILVLMLFSTILFIYKQDNRLDKIRYFSLATCLLFGYIMFSLGLLILYINSYSSYEGLKLASFGRYMHIYLIAFFIISACLWIKYWNYLDSTRSNKFVILSAVIFGLFVFKTHKVHENVENKYLLADKTLEFVPNQEENTMVIFQNDQGYYWQILRFKLFPRLTTEHCDSFGLPSKSDNWICNWNADQFKAELEKRDYILLGYVDQRFWDKYGKLLGISKMPVQPTLYKISHLNNKLEFKKIF